MIWTVGTTVYSKKTWTWDPVPRECSGLTQDTEATEIGECEFNCTDDIDCKVYQWYEDNTCWRGNPKSTECDGDKNVLEGYRMRPIYWKMNRDKCEDLKRDSTAEGSVAQCQYNCQWDLTCELYQYNRGGICHRGKTDGCDGKGLKSLLVESGGTKDYKFIWKKLKHQCDGLDLDNTAASAQDCKGHCETDDACSVWQFYFNGQCWRGAPTECFSGTDARIMKGAYRWYIDNGDSEDDEDEQEEEEAASAEEEPSAENGERRLLSPSVPAPQCVDDKFGLNFCSEWCNTEGYWGCGTSMIRGHDSRNTANVDYECSCAGCNGCAAAEGTCDHNREKCCAYNAKWDMVPMQTWGSTPEGERAWHTANQCDDVMGGSALANCPYMCELTSCPAGSWAVEYDGQMLGADRPGCGIGGCGSRHDHKTPELCADRCEAEDACAAFSFSPESGNPSLAGKTVCQIYPQEESFPTRLLKGANDEYTQLFCKTCDGTRCGANFGGCSCGSANPYCNEDNGWCGSTYAHRDAQFSTQYDYITQCKDDHLGFNFCSEWCGPEGSWGCGEINLSPFFMGVAYRCECAGCNNCPAPEGTCDQTRQKCCAYNLNYGMVPHETWGTTPEEEKAWHTENQCDDVMGGSALSNCPYFCELSTCPIGFFSLDYEGQKLGADREGCGIGGCDSRHEHRTLEACADRCTEEDSCAAFSFSPESGNPDLAGKQVCSIYTREQASPDRVLQGANDEYTQLFCKGCDGTKCGENFGRCSCGKALPFCNEETGSCGATNAHRDAQPLTRYDYKDFGSCSEYWAETQDWCIDGHNAATYEEVEFNTCRDYCAADPDCKSFDWRDVTFGYNCAISHVTSSEVPEGCSNLSWNYYERSNCEGGCLKQNSDPSLPGALVCDHLSNAGECRDAHETWCSMERPDWLANLIRKDSERIRCPRGFWSVKFEGHLLGVDREGCGMGGCDSRYDATTVEACKQRCEAEETCFAFAYAPEGGNSNQPGKTICSIYTFEESQPTRRIVGTNGEYSQIFCKSRKCTECSCYGWDGSNYSNCRQVTEDVPCDGYCVKCEADGTTPMPGAFAEMPEKCIEYENDDSLTGRRLLSALEEQSQRKKY